MNTYLSLSQERQREGDLPSIMEEFVTLSKVRIRCGQFKNNCSAGFVLVGQICDDTEPLICGDGLPDPTPEDICRYEKVRDTLDMLEGSA